MRMFVALSIPSKEKKKIHRAAGPLREGDLPVRWVEPENYHITLKFLGDVQIDRVDPLSKALEDIAGSNVAFEAQVRGFGAFPTIRRPNVLWLGVTPSAALRCLKHDLERGLVECGFEQEPRGFHPHLTLGRVGRNGGAGVFRGLDDLVAKLDYAGSFRVAKVHLMQSRRSSSGPRYRVVSSSKLN